MNFAFKIHNDLVSRSFPAASLGGVVDPLTINELTVNDQLNIPLGDVTIVPPGPKGSIILDSTTCELYISNGTIWEVGSIPDPLTVNTLNVSNQLNPPVGDITIVPPGPIGSLIIDSTTNDLYISDGVSWVLSSGGSLPASFYEEGTFAPEVGGSGDFGQAAYSSNIGYYTRMGRLVTFQLNIDAFSFLDIPTIPNPAAGDLIVRGLPYTASTNDDANSSISVSLFKVQYTTLTPFTGKIEQGDAIQATIEQGGNNITFTKLNDINSREVVANGLNSVRIVLAGSYITDGFSFIPDNTIPDTRILTMRSQGDTVNIVGVTFDTDATFTWEGIGIFTGFEYRIDGGAWTPTTLTTATFGGLSSPAQHIFEVRAVNSALPPPTEDQTPATRIWVIGGEPDTIITSTPPLSTGSTDATFTYAGVGPVSYFETQLDTDPWVNQGIVQSVSYTGLTGGNHTFKVRAVFTDGINIAADSTPAQYIWQVDGSPPFIFITDPTTSIIVQTNQMSATLEARDGALVTDPISTDLDHFEYYLRNLTTGDPIPVNTDPGAPWVALPTGTNPETEMFGPLLHNNQYILYAIAVDLASNRSTVWAETPVINVDLVNPSSVFNVCPSDLSQPIDDVQFTFQAEYVPDFNTGTVPVVAPTFFVSINGGIEEDVLIHSDPRIVNATVTQPGGAGTPWLADWQIQMVDATAVDDLTGLTYGTAFLPNGSNTVATRVQSAVGTQPNVTDCTFTVSSLAAYGNLFFWGKFDDVIWDGNQTTLPVDPRGNIDFTANPVTVTSIRDASTLTSTAAISLDATGATATGVQFPVDNAFGIDFEGAADYLHSPSTTREISNRFMTVVYLIKEHTTDTSLGGTLFSADSFDSITRRATGTTTNGYSFGGITTATWGWEPNATLYRNEGRGWHTTLVGGNGSSIAPKQLYRSGEYVLVVMRLGNSTSGVSGTTANNTNDIWLNGVQISETRSFGSIHNLIANAADITISPNRQVRELALFTTRFSDSQVQEIYNIFQTKLPPSDNLQQYTTLLHDTFTEPSIATPLPNHIPDINSSATGWQYINADGDLNPADISVSTNPAYRALNINGNDNNAAVSNYNPPGTAVVQDQTLPNIPAPPQQRVCVIWKPNNIGNNGLSGVQNYINTNVATDGTSLDGLILRRIDPDGVNPQAGKYWIIGFDPNNTLFSGVYCRGYQATPDANPNNPDNLIQLFSTQLTTPYVTANNLRELMSGIVVGHDSSTGVCNVAAMGSGETSAAAGINTFSNTAEISFTDGNIGGVEISSAGTGFGIAMTRSSAVAGPGAFCNEFKVLVL